MIQELLIFFFFRLRNATPYEEEDVKSVQSRNVRLMALWYSEHILL